MTVASITAYEVYLTVHVLAAVVWVGGAVTAQLFAIRAARSNEPGKMAGFAADIEWVGMRVYVPSSLLLIVFGFLLVGEGNWDYELWIVAAIVVWVASFLTGAGFLGPESGRISKIIAEQGPESPEAVARLNRIFLISRIELVLLILVVIDMALKPGA